MITCLSIFRTYNQTKNTTKVNQPRTKTYDTYNSEAKHPTLQLNSCNKQNTKRKSQIK